MNIANKILSTSGTLGILGILSIVAFYPSLPKIEGRVLPVVSDVAVESVEKTPNGVSFFVRFKKNRQCKFIGLQWYKNGVQLILEFEPESSRKLPTRLTGKQFSGPWEIKGVSSLRASEATVVHQCHPLWQTHTSFYK